MKNQSLFAFFAGVIAGGAVALLLAPESGEKTRRKIGKFISDERDKLVEAIGEVNKDYDKATETAKSRRRAGRPTKARA
ncbi:hypothetical protein FACS1894159_03880 [Bacteroidia bacterium]|nr:hypothetical protein FACS1894159_03880 [Bacteroidia bacterium]